MRKADKTKNDIARYFCRTIICRIVGISVFLLLLATGSATADIAISADVEPKKAAIGDRISYIISLKANDGEMLAPQVKLLNPEPFEVVNVQIVQDAGTAKIIFSLAPFDVGKLKLPKYRYEWRDSENALQSIETDDVYVEIKSVLENPQSEPDLNAIKGEEKAKINLFKYIVPLLILLLIIGAIVALYLYLRKRKENAPEIPAPPAPPDEAALKKLEEIKRENLYAKGKVKEYFSDISNTVRTYLEERYRIEAMEQTTWELEQSFPKEITSHKEAVIGMLETADTAKFAKATPPPDTAESVLNQAFNFVKKTGLIKSNGMQKGENG